LYNTINFSCTWLNSRFFFVQKLCTNVIDGNHCFVWSLWPKDIFKDACSLWKILQLRFENLIIQRKRQPDNVNNIFFIFSIMFHIKMLNNYYFFENYNPIQNNTPHIIKVWKQISKLCFGIKTYIEGTHFE